MAFSKTVLDGETLTRKNFKEPPMKMGILPFWFWNGELDREEMVWQLKEYYEKGITGLFIHGRFGLKVPYLSEGWFERTKFVVDRAKEIGIDIWVYDEMNWPSGTAEKQVLKSYPHLKQKYLELVVLDVQGPLFTFLEASDSRYVNTGNSKPIAAFACRAEEFETGIKDLLDLTPNLSFDVVIPWEAPAGHWKLLYFLEKEIDYYIDTLNPESTKRFIEITHEGYKKVVGKDFGKTVPGFYTDEPAMYYYQVGVDNYVVPWSQQMFKIFRERRGYDLKPYLAALYADMGEQTAKIRYDFWRTLTEQYSDTYYKQIRDWCDENGLIFTGHLLLEEWLRLHARCEGNIFKYLKHMHLIGVDHLYPKIGTEDEPAEHVALKIASSAAHHFGSTRLLCESMGGTYWDCTLERMKWIANWEYVLGVNLFNNHGYHYSIEGERKRDWPPSQFYHHSWWKYYKHFTTYMARLGHILSGGTHIAKILILYPLNSIWTNYTPQKRNSVGNVIEAEFYYLTDTMLRLHYDFDYVEEDVLNEALIENGQIRIADEHYAVLILPPVTHIKRKTFESIRKFVHSGGKVIADTLLPFEFLEADQNHAPQDVENLFGVNPLKLRENFQRHAKYDVTRKSKNGDVFVIHGSGLYSLKKKEELKRLLNLCVTPDVIISNENIFYLHRVKDGFDIYFLVNTTQQPQNGVEISFEQIGSPELWDATTGSTRQLHVFRAEQGRLQIRLDFSPSESNVVVLHPDIPDRHISDTNLEIFEFTSEEVRGYATNDVRQAFVELEMETGKKKLAQKTRAALPDIVLDGEFEFKVEDDNALCISRWKMTEAKHEPKGSKFFDENYDDSQWLNVTFGAWEMQLPQERDYATYPVLLWYRTEFYIEDLPDNTRLLIDGFSGEKFKLFINGQQADVRGKRSRLDAEIKEVNIQPFVRRGKNIVAVELIVTKRTDGILDLLKIIGNFDLQPEGNSFKIIRPKSRIKLGDWTKQGLPFYSGTGVFSKEFELPKDYLDGKVFLEVDCGEDVLEVSVNGHAPNVIPWHPYSLEIGKWLVPGKNTIQLKVTNTLINILEGIQKASGIFQEPRITHQHVYSFVLDSQDGRK